MKNWTAFFVCFFSLGLSGLAFTCDQLAPTYVLPATVSATVRIRHSWTDDEGGAASQHFESSLGTVVGPNVVLTHNHFRPQANPDREASVLAQHQFFQPESPESETYAFTTATGQAFSVPVSKLTLRALDAGTQLIYLPGDVTLAPAPLADQAAIDRLAEGEWLTADYWDEASQRFAQENFQLRRIETGVATLSDPQGVIRPGDSGGGIYVAGKLIGNTWARYVEVVSGQPSGAFNVALLPAEAIQRLQPKQARVAPVWPLEPLSLGSVKRSR